jgi:hypothetical protein
MAEWAIQASEIAAVQRKVIFMFVSKEPLLINVFYLSAGLHPL